MLVACGCGGEHLLHADVCLASTPSAGNENLTLQRAFKAKLHPSVEEPALSRNPLLDRIKVGDFTEVQWGLLCGHRSQYSVHDLVIAYIPELEPIA